MSDRRRKRSRRPTIRFTPYSWAKLLYLRDAGDTEIGGFGITSADDLLLVQDICLVRQRCTAMTVEFVDDSIADLFDEQVDAGRKPEQFGRVWIHTHPGESAEPSFTDEETFQRSFGNVDWAVMFILAQEGESFARLRFNVGPQTSQRMNVVVDYSQPFGGSATWSWKKEYEANVARTPFGRPRDPVGRNVSKSDLCVDDEAADYEWLNRFESDPLFLDWEDDACPQRLSTIPA